MDRAIPAGVPSYTVYPDTEEETKERERSASKWRVGDDSTYEPRQPKFKVNRQNTEELESHKKQHGMRYPKWWGDMSEEKTQKEEPSQGHEQSQNVSQLSFVDPRVEICMEC